MPSLKALLKNEKHQIVNGEIVQVKGNGLYLTRIGRKLFNIKSAVSETLSPGCSVIVAQSQIAWYIIGVRQTVFRRQLEVHVNG